MLRPCALSVSGRVSEIEHREIIFWFFVFAWERVQPNPVSVCVVCVCILLRNMMSLVVFFSMFSIVGGARTNTFQARALSSTERKHYSAFFFCTVCLIFYYGTWCRSGELFRPWTPRLLNFISFIIATFLFSNCLSTSRRETTCQRQSRKIVFFFWIEEKTRVEVARFHFVFGAESFERVLNNHAKHI